MNKKGKFRRFFQTLTIVVVGVLLFWGLTNYDVVLGWLTLLAEVLSPFIVGVVLALILNVPMSFFERNIFRRKKDGSRGRIAAKIARPVSITLTYLACFGIIALVLALVIPSIKETALQLYEQVPAFVNRVFDMANNNEQLNKWMTSQELTSDKVINAIAKRLEDSTFIEDTLTGTVNLATGMVSGLVNFVIGFVFSIYILAQKEKLKNQLYRICTAIFPQKAVGRMSHVANLSLTTFSNFLSGQGLEACILGTLCMIGMRIFGFPYAATIGVLIAVTAFIPIVGAFIGAGVGAFLIMITSFKQAVLFVVFIVVLQQIEGNLIYPKVVGKSVGLPSLWVLFAITIGGNIGGILGMFVAVPICSVLYCLLGDFVNGRNRRKAEGGFEPSDSDSAPPQWLGGSE